MTRVPGIGRVLLFFCVYFLGAEMGHLLSFPGDFASFWPPSGILLIGLLMTPPQRWSYLIACTCLGNLVSDVGFHQEPVWVSVGFSLGNSIEGIVGALLIQRFVGSTFQLERPRDIAAFALVPSLVSMPISALFGATITRLAFGADFGTGFVMWWASGVTGILLVVPAALTALQPNHTLFQNRMQPRRLLEALSLMLTLALIVIFVFGKQQTPLGFVIAPIFIWIAFRFEVAGVGTAMLVIATPAVWHTINGRGPYAIGDSVVAKVLMLQGCLSVSTISFMMLAVVIRERRRIASTIEASEFRYRDLFENVSDMIHSVGPDGAILFTNRVWRETLGYTEDEVRSLSIFQIIHPGDAARCRGILHRLVEGHDVGRIECRFVTKAGDAIMVEGSTSCRFENGQAVGTRAIFRDVTENRQQMRQLELARRELQDAIAKLRLTATTDGMTGLNNRAAFQARLGEEVSRAKRYDTPFSLLMIDVDHFKTFNDTYGHQAGDEVLTAVGRILRDVARTTDFVARYGGEEFAVLLPNTPVEGACTVAERIRQAVCDHRWAHRSVTVCVGAATLGPSAPDGPALVRQADAALYRGKHTGRNRAIHANVFTQENVDSRFVAMHFEGPTVAAV
ncbi:MAG: diguanylate cyclase [Gemmataceae bacterium]